MKYKILQLDANGRISFTKEELEKLLDEVYEEGRRDGYGWRYSPYITYNSTGDTSAWGKTTIHVGDNPNDMSFGTTTGNASKYTKNSYIINNNEIGTTTKEG